MKPCIPRTRLNEIWAIVAGIAVVSIILPFLFSSTILNIALIAFTLHNVGIALFGESLRKKYQESLDKEYTDI